MALTRHMMANILVAGISHRSFVYWIPLQRSYWQEALKVAFTSTPTVCLMFRPSFLLNNIKSSGEFKAPLTPSSIPRRGLFDTVTTISGEEKEEFLRFTSRMLQWLPEKRATVQELLDDPWMRSLEEY